MQITPGRGGKGRRGSGRRQYIPSNSESKEKKQKIEEINDKTWEEMDEDHHNKQYDLIQNNLISIIDESNKEKDYSIVNSYLNKPNDESIGTVDNETIKITSTWNNESNEGKGRMYTVQVSVKLSKEREKDNEELIFDVGKNQKISYNELMTLLSEKNNLKMVSKLNNKIIVQNDENIKLFSLKNEFDCERLFELLSQEQKRAYIMTPEVSIEQKKYLYNLLENYGFDKQMLYRKSTTYPRE